MSRLSLNDWYRYLESQFVEEEQKVREASPPAPTAPAQAEESVDKREQLPIEPERSLEEQATSHPIEASAPIETSMGESRTPLIAPHSAYALVSIRVPDFLAFVPLLREELGLPAPEPIQEGTRAVIEPAGMQPSASPESPAESAPRLRKHRGKKSADPEQLIPPEMDEIWAKLPRYLRYLAEWSDDSVTDKYYPVRGRESREELIARLTDPVLSLEEVARLLGVCPATVRRYTNRGWLRHFRTEGNQRRFRLSDIVAFLEAQIQRVPPSSRRSSKARTAQRQRPRSSGESS